MYDSKMGPAAALSVFRSGMNSSVDRSIQNMLCHGHSVFCATSIINVYHCPSLSLKCISNQIYFVFNLFEICASQ